MSNLERVHSCYKAMRKERPSSSRSFLIGDVSDRMRLPYGDVEKLLDEEVLIQLELF
jgi:hypothetical protein